MRRATLLFLISGLLPLATPQTSTDARARLATLRRDMALACTDLRAPACLPAVEQLDRFLNGRADLLVRRARLAAANAATDQALSLLAQFAQSGLAADLNDPVFTALRNHPRWPAVEPALTPRPVAAGLPLFATLPQADLQPEGIAWDQRGQRLFVGSRGHRQIWAWTAAHKWQPWTQPAQDGVAAVMALAVDDRRQHLWATAQPLAHQQPQTPAGQAELLQYDLATGQLLHRWSPPQANVLGDLGLCPDGTAVVADAEQGKVYALRPGADTFTTLAGPHQFVSPQGLACRAGAVLVADYARGLARISLRTRRLTWLTHTPQLVLYGTDGLAWDGRFLYGVQNGTDPHRIVRWELDPAWTRVLAQTVLESGTPGLGEPTHITIAGPDVYYLRNTGWDALDEQAHRKPAAKLTPASVGRYRP